MHVDRRRARWQALIAGGGLVLLTACGGSPVSAPDPETPLPGTPSVLAPATLGYLDALPEDDVDPATLYVSSSAGDDADDGQTPGSAWRSLQHGLDTVQPGQTLYVMSGTYDEVDEPGNAHYTLDTSGTEDAWIRIAAAPGEQPVIEASDGNGLNVRGSFVEVAGFEVRGRGFDADNSYGWGMLIRNSHRVRLVGNTISDMAVGGISSVESSNLEVLDNVVYDNSFWGTEQGSGISFWRSKDSGLGPDADGYHNRIIGNTIYRNENKVFSRWFPDEELITDGNGIILDTSNEMGYTGRTLVANNVVFDNGGRGILVFGASRVDIVSNTTYRNGRTVGLLDGPVEIATARADDVRVFNNVAWSLDGAPAVMIQDSSNVIMGGNVLVTDNHSGHSTDLDLVTTGDPGLVAPGIDPSSADFRPRIDSLVRGQAIPIAPALTFDADGRDRSASPRNAGAYDPG